MLCLRSTGLKERNFVQKYCEFPCRNSQNGCAYAYP